MAHFNERGRWWIQGKKSRVIGGGISCSADGGIILKLDEDFEDGLDRLSKAHKAESLVVHGEGFSGAQFTLLGARHHNWSMSIGYGSRAIYRGIGLIRGGHTGNFTSIRARSLYFTINSGEAWLQNVIIALDEHSGHPRVVPHPCYRYSIRGMDGELRICPTWSQKINQFRGIQVDHELVFWLSMADLRPLDELLAFAMRFRNYISLCMGQPTSIQKLSFDPYETRAESKVTPKLELFIGLSTNESQSKHNWGQFTLPFPLIRRDMSNILSQWEMLYDKIEAPLNLFFSSLQPRPVDLDLDYLIVTQALEPLSE